MTILLSDVNRFFIIKCLLFIRLLCVPPVSLESKSINVQTKKKYTIKFNNLSVESSIKKMQRELNISFFYNPELVK